MGTGRESGLLATSAISFCQIWFPWCSQKQRVRETQWIRGSLFEWFFNAISGVCPSFMKTLLQEWRCFLGVMQKAKSCLTLPATSLYVHLSSNLRARRIVPMAINHRLIEQMQTFGASAPAISLETRQGNASDCKRKATRQELPATSRHPPTRIGPFTASSKWRIV